MTEMAHLRRPAEWWVFGGDRRGYVGGTALCAVALAVSSFLPTEVRVLAWGLTGAAYLAGFTAIIDPGTTSLKVGIFGAEPWTDQLRRIIDNRTS
jgi:hypothetical protein